LSGVVVEHGASAWWIIRGRAIGANHPLRRSRLIWLPAVVKVAPISQESSSVASSRTTPGAALAALGVVYGDLGTSPLYTLQAVVRAAGGHLTPEFALGTLSLIFWSLVITISVKYCAFVMKADNYGEGGILALMSLVGRNSGERGLILVTFGLFGAALIYGDGIITPAISVLSALEGINVATQDLKPYVMPVAVVVLVCLFGFQRLGTAKIGKVFGPVMVLWFLSIGVIGAAGVFKHPSVVWAVNPIHAFRFLADHGWGSLAILGGVFLAVTGGEALYADMGHIGRNPIRTSWYCIVLPALLLSYAGQTGLLLDQPQMTDNPFFKIVPEWALYPMVALATLATIIASQAIITGSFSLTRQAMQLGWFPGLRIRQTSDVEYGQIYVPTVN
jgi:KUP system potassium uptake protein